MICIIHNSPQYNQKLKFYSRHAWYFNNFWCIIRSIWIVLFFSWGWVKVVVVVVVVVGGGGVVIVSKHLRPKDHRRKINKIHNDFEAYQVFMQIFYVKMLGYSFWSNNIKKFCFGGIKTVYTQKIIWEKLTKFRNIISTISSLHMPKNVLTLSNHIQLMHTKSVFTSYHFSATLLQLSLSTLYHFLPYFIFYKLWKI